MNDEGRFGQYGGSFIPEILYSSQQQLLKAYREAMADTSFVQLVKSEMQDFSGRPTPLTYCANLTKTIGGAQIYLKREDLNHSGAHKMNNVIGQGLLAKRMGKTRIIAETGAGQHGVASALVAARLGLECTVYMGAHDIERQYPNVFWMKQLGATVVPVTTGAATLKDALDEALRDWSSSYEDTHYLIGTSCGCAPYPEMVAGFQSVIGEEVKEQSIQQFVRYPDRIYACVGGGSNACGIFLPFVDTQTELVGVEAGGRSNAPGDHAMRFNTDQARFGIAQGFATRFLQDSEGQLQPTHSISAGLDYVGVSPILADLEEKGKVRMTSANDNEVIEAFKMLTRHEGIIPALESSHAVAGALREAAGMSAEEYIVINISGRGDKDIFNIAKALNDEPFTDFLHAYLKEETAQ
ncbi:tryptophan synthase subunit beta [Neptunomonas qingdaonensis]|uniref:Tryptophan synthase beta chain n=1 Tax=Neptunomonas qingdaonensis TaxID=1045558 RepID=A0A1I2RSS5_9GAMM|nr:tryptophan synthase subunit beta [Neptunomonas qingdaonensis]SFG40871.1 tryptophan synthase beta chain [Neptunomonas qingdaonensis]